MKLSFFIDAFIVALLFLLVPSSVLFAQRSSHARHANTSYGGWHGMYGQYSMTREASGTSWQPDVTPMFAVLGDFAGWHTMLHGIADGVADHEGGRRGDSKLFSPNWIALTGQHDFEKTTIGLRSMFSAEPFTIGQKGYPLLLQTGETGNGRTPLIDRQHPHDLFMELAIAASYKLENDNSVFCYVGYPGEPALGPPVFIHRFTGMDNPQAPIGHHWMDSTHVTFGVVTLGYIWDKVKIDGSLFTGREPDENRFNFETPRSPSYSLRVTYNPISSLSLQVSAGHLVSPEQLNPCVNITRITASAMYHHRFSIAEWQTLLAWGRNIESPGKTTDAFLVESEAIFFDQHTVFGRFERVAKNDLFLLTSPFYHETFTVKKASVGYIFDCSTWCSIAWGFGAAGNFSIVPDEIKPEYSGTPFSYMFFFRAKIV